MMRRDDLLFLDTAPAAHFWSEDMNSDFSDLEGDDKKGPTDMDIAIRNVMLALSVGFACMIIAAALAALGVFA